GAKDAIDGTVTPVCLPESGSAFPYGRTIVTCTAEDRAGNVGASSFGVVVRLPTVPGAIFDPGAPTGPALTTVQRGERVLVHVDPGAFSAHTVVTITFIDAQGTRDSMGVGASRADGSLDAHVLVPHSVASGPGQVLAQSTRDGVEYDRAWKVT